MAENENGWVKLYHPTGALLTVPISTNPFAELKPETAQMLLRSVDNLITAGFTVNAPGLEEGELSEEVNAVARREASDDDSTPIIDFYSSNTRLAKKFMHVYLNTSEDVAAFESATGIKLASLTPFESPIAIERTHKSAAKYIKAIRPIKLVFEISQKWQEWKALPDESKGREPHKRMLLRYDTGRDVKPAAMALETAPGAVEQKYKKLEAPLVQKVADAMFLKPAHVAKILAKCPEDILTFTTAQQYVEANLAQEA